MGSAPSVGGGVPRAIIPRDPFLGVVSGRVCEGCGGSVWWRQDRFVCSECGSTDYRMRELPESPPSACFPSRASLTEPEWTGGFRGRVGKLLWERGLQPKAVRFLNCKQLGRPGVCSMYPLEHKFFVPHGCEVVFCKECADDTRRALLIEYWHVVCNAILDFAGERVAHERLCALLEKSSGLAGENILREIGELWGRVGKRIRAQNWVFARITLTLRADGAAIAGTKVKAMNECVARLMRTIVGSRKGYGMLFVDEVGFERRGHLPDAQRVAHGLNLHAHGLYFGPRLEWARTRDLWMEITKAKFGVESRGFYISAVKRFVENPGRAIRWALNHMFKYVSKPPAVTPESLAALIAAFNGAKRVHSLGLFYGKKPKREQKNCPCPKCHADGVASTVCFELDFIGNGIGIPRLQRIDDLTARGYVPLREAGREAILAMGVSREESWGASP
jgi:hypothetical protein